VAAHVVMSAGADIKLFGLDVTSRAVVPDRWINSLAALDTHCGRAAHAMMTAYARLDPLLHDPCPVAWLLAPGLFTSQPCAVAVDWRPGLAEGHLSVWPASRDDQPLPPNADVFTDLHCTALLELVHERLARLR
jgi:purine nucleosidase